MTVSNQTASKSVDGLNSVGQVVAFSFPIAATGDLMVMTKVAATGVEDTLEETTNYTVSISGDTGGTVTMVTAVATSKEIHVIRDTPMTQATDLEQGGAFNAETVEEGFDKLTRIVIELNEKIGRTIRMPITDDATTELTTFADREDDFIAFNGSGNVIATPGVIPDDVTVSDPFGEDLVGAADAEAGRAVLDVLDQPTWTIAKEVVGAVTTYYAQASPRSPFSDMDDTDFVDLMDAVLATISSVPATAGIRFAGERVVFKRGTYVLTKKWTIPPLQVMTFDAGLTQMSSSVTDDDLIVIDSCMNCRFEFGIIDGETTGKGVRITPLTEGPDGETVIGVNYFHFIGVENRHATGVGVCIDPASDNVNGNTFYFDELGGAAIGLQILNPSGGQQLFYNRFNFHAHDMVNCIVIGESQTDLISFNTFHGTVRGTAGASDRGIVCYGDNNAFFVDIENCGTSQLSNQDIDFIVGTSGNVVYGYLDDGYTDSGNNSVMTARRIAQQYTQITPTTDGSGTGIIPTGTSTVWVTDAHTDANKIMLLPTARVGQTIKIVTRGVNSAGSAGDDCAEIRCAVALNAINDKQCGPGDGNELAVKCFYHYIAEAVSASRWIVRGFDEAGADEGALVPDAV